MLTDRHTHRQNDYHTLPPTLHSEGNYLNIINIIIKISNLISYSFPNCFLPYFGWVEPAAVDIMRVTKSAYNKTQWGVNLFYGMLNEKVSLSHSQLLFEVFF